MIKNISKKVVIMVVTLLLLVIVLFGWLGNTGENEKIFLQTPPAKKIPFGVMHREFQEDARKYDRGLLSYNRKT